jgi:outer membrane lipoprotein-sorting protein
MPRQSSLILAFCAALAAPAAALAQDVPAATPVDDPKARRIVEEADRIRFPAEGFQVEVSIVSTGKDKAPDERKYRVLSKGNENTIVMITEPATERGQILLMKGRELWVFLPNISQPVRLSLAQRLTGQVANGDLARANFAGDYYAQVLRTETIDGANYDVLELNAVDRSVTYQRVVYWVRQGSSAPYRAEFYSAVQPAAEDVRLREIRVDGGKDAPDADRDGGRAEKRRAVGARLQRDEASRASRQDVHEGLPEEARVTWHPAVAVTCACRARRPLNPSRASRPSMPRSSSSEKNNG